ncbi:MAG: galactokinase [Firmicutes bacterium]|nr:galactokinase [Bacillota bacterium]MDH7494691.1 galactokinase [Bacillota bacterium]
MSDAGVVGGASGAGGANGIGGVGDNGASGGGLGVDCAFAGGFECRAYGERSARVLRAFCHVFRDVLDEAVAYTEDASPVRVVRAPGRVNLIGEHTDYNDGFVLPAAIDRDVTMAARRRRDRKVRAFSIDYDVGTEFSLDDIRPDSVHAWTNYIRGTLDVLMKRGLPVTGMDLAVTGDVPRGAGLSSSAALETATAVAARVVGGFALEGPELALACQEAENRFVGVRCGIMDQFASALGKAGHALFIDCRSHRYELVPVPRGYRIVICDSGVRRGLRDSEYNVRRAQCEEAVRLLKEDLPHVRALRDVSSGELAALQGKLSEEVRRRAAHVIAENERVTRGVKALREGRVDEFGRLMVESHESLARLYEVSCRELDLLVDIALAWPGVIGARMTGAGFGGCTVNLVREEAVGGFAETVMSEYGRRVDSSKLSAPPQVYVCEAADGAGVVQ